MNQKFEIYPLKRVLETLEISHRELFELLAQGVARPYVFGIGRVPSTEPLEVFNSTLAFASALKEPEPPTKIRVQFQSAYFFTRLDQYLEEQEIDISELIFPSNEVAKLHRAIAHKGTKKKANETDTQNLWLRREKVGDSYIWRFQGEELLNNRLKVFERLIHFIKSGGDPKHFKSSDLGIDVSLGQILDKKSDLGRQLRKMVFNANKNNRHWSITEEALDQLRRQNLI